MYMYHFDPHLTFNPASPHKLFVLYAPTTMEMVGQIIYLFIYLFDLFISFYSSNIDLTWPKPSTPVQGCVASVPPKISISFGAVLAWLLLLESQDHKILNLLLHSLPIILLIYHLTDWLVHSICFEQIKVKMLPIGWHSYSQFWSYWVLEMILNELWPQTVDTR